MATQVVKNLNFAVGDTLKAGDFTATRKLVIVR